MISSSIFLGWDKPHLDVATDWFLANKDLDLDQTIIALPGRRAVRGLEERFALYGDNRPQPRIITVGDLSDELFNFPTPRANDLTRMLCWVHALRELSASELALLVPKSPQQQDLNGWMNIAKLLRNLHGKLAGEMLTFRDVVEREVLPTGKESKRWNILAKTQDGYAAKLDEIGEHDPHLARREAIMSENVDCKNDIYLLGIIDLNQLQSQALQKLNTKVTPLVFAPEELKDRFDQLGCVDVDAWTDSNLRIDLEDAEWTVANQPQDQAEAALKRIGQAQNDYSAEDISIALLDDEVTPFIERQLHAEGIKTHKAEGEYLRSTSPWRLLDAISSWLDGRKVTDLAAICRHVEFMDALGIPHVAGQLDRYFQEHLPHKIGEQLIKDRYDYKDLNLLLEQMEEIFPHSKVESANSPKVWSQFIHNLFNKVWGEKELNPDNPQHSGTVKCLQEFAKLLENLEATPEGFDDLTHQPLGATFRLLLRETATQSLPQSSDASFIEMMGWLEMRMDPAKLCIVCGFNEGFVPESFHADPFLPNKLRCELQIPDNRSRFARDAYSLAAIRNSHQSVFLICGRNSRLGDPRRPSRLLFQCEEKEIASRMQLFLSEQEEAAITSIPEPSSAYQLPRDCTKDEMKSMAVTDFDSYLWSPYGFYLERVLNLKTENDDSREMDARLYGTVLHRTLESFGKQTELHECVDEKVIYEYLENQLWRHGKDLFGKNPLPAVQLQLQQMRFRLQFFARQQVQEVQDGWRIVEAEYEVPKEGVEVCLDGENVTLRAKIDRIDQHIETKQFRILDYKSSDKSSDPYNSKTQEWSRLQLPLYRKIAKKVGRFGENPKVGLWFVAKSDSQSKIIIPNTDEPLSDEQEFDAWTVAEKQAGRILREIRSGENENDKWPFADDADKLKDPILAGIAGTTLFVEEEDEEEKE